MLNTPSARRAVATMLAAGALAAGAVTLAPMASAGPEQDQRFQQIVEGLGVPTESPEQVGQFGVEICKKVDEGKIEAARTVRSLRSVLMAKGMDKGQATHFIWGAVEVYCPQFGPLVGR